MDEPDSREALASDDVLTPEDVAGLDNRLDRLDRASATGPWTAATLAASRDQPGVLAADLDAALGREKGPFKVDVRKLKDLGLTHTLQVGYRLSPRGVAYVRLTGRETHARPDDPLRNLEVRRPEVRRLAHDGWPMTGHVVSAP